MHNIIKWYTRVLCIKVKAKNLYWQHCIKNRHVDWLRSIYQYMLMCHSDCMIQKLAFQHWNPASLMIWRCISEFSGLHMWKGIISTERDIYTHTHTLCRLKVYIGLSVCAPIYCTHCILFWFTLYKALGLRLYFYQKTNQKEKLSCGSAGKKCAFSYLIYNFGNLLNKNIQKSFEMFSSYNLYCRMC